jgi:hypothetical protein
MQHFPCKFTGKYKALHAFPFLVLMLLMNGCNPNLIPMKGKYVDASTEITVAKSADSTWVKITELFAAKGLKVKSIDKTKGQMITTKTSFISAYAFEDKDGQLEEPRAWVVIPKVYLKEKQWMPKDIRSKWDIQISENAGGRTVIKIDPVVTCTYHPNMFTVVEDRGRSTGRLEALIKSSIE